MSLPVRSEGRWWGDWLGVPEEDRERILADVQSQIRGRLPPATEVHRRHFGCYPRHALLRLVLPPAHGSREGYAFYAPGQVYPLSWGLDAIQSLDEVALEIRSARQAEEYLRFTLWAHLSARGRGFPVESVDQLRLRPGATLGPGEAERVAGLASPLTLVQPEDEDPEGSYRFRGSILWDEGLVPADFVVGRYPRGVGESRSERWACRFVQAADVEPLPLPVVADTAAAGDRYFVLLRETTLTAEELARKIRSGPVHQARVLEPVHLENAAFSAPVVLSQVTFEHGADFGGARFEKGLFLEQCVLEGRLGLEGSHVGGSLHAQGLWFHREGSHGTHESLKKLSRYGAPLVDLDASGLVVEGSVYLEGLRAANLVDLSRARIEGDLRLGGGRIGRPREPSLTPVRSFAVRMDNARIGGDVDLVYLRDEKLVPPPEPRDETLNEVVPGYATPSTLIRGSVMATGVQIEGNLELAGLRCEGDLLFAGCRVDGYLDAGARGPTRRLMVLGDVRLHRADIGGHVALHGTWVGGDLGLDASSVGGSILASTVATGDGRVAPLHVRGRLDLSGIRAHDVRLEAPTLGLLRVATGRIDRLAVRPGLEEVRGGEADDTALRPVRRRLGRIGGVELFDLDLAKRLALEAEIDGHAELGNLVCGGDVELWSDRRDLREAALLESAESWAPGEPAPAETLRTRISGDLVCTGLRIAGRLVLTNVVAGGRILLKNCQVEQDLNCASVGPNPASAQGRTRTQCSHLDLELTRCGGDVDLAGLHVGDGGSVDARQLQVTGRILFARALGSGPGAPGEEGRGGRVQARIAGDLDLSAAEGAQLVLAASSVGGRVNLERGRFRRLDAIEPRSFSGHNLTDLRVDRWGIPDEHLRAFLDSSEPFARATYVEIERVLRNKAQDGEADRVYRAMRARAIGEIRGQRARKRISGEGGADRDHRERWWTRAAGHVSHSLRTSGALLQGVLYGWGTLYWAPLLVFSLVFVPATWTLLSRWDNITPAAGLLATADPAPGPAPPLAGTAWGAGDGFWLTVRYHVPVVPLSAREDFRPADRPAVFDAPGMRPVQLPFSAESYAFSVYLLSWILWPLFLVGLARRIVRETT